MVMRLIRSLPWVSEKNPSGIRGVLNPALGKYVSSGGYPHLGYRLSSPVERWQRVVECSGLDDRYAAEAGVGGSNPPLSASYMVPPEDGVCGSPVSEKIPSRKVGK